MELPARLWWTWLFLRETQLCVASGELLRNNSWVLGCSAKRAWPVKLTVMWRQTCVAIASSCRANWLSGYANSLCLRSTNYISYYIYIYISYNLFIQNYAIITDLPDYALVYWADEGSVSAVKATCVSASTKIGDDCVVTLRGMSYTGQLAARG